MKYMLIILLSCTIGFTYGQKQISGKSKAQKISLSPTFERGLPPELFADLSFKDSNENGILEADETAKLKITVTNSGKGIAQGLKVWIQNDQVDEALKIADQNEIPFLRPGKSMEITIPIYADLDIKTAEHKLKINVSEHFGYDMDPAFLLLNTLEFQKPKLSFSGLEIVDSGEGTGAITIDGLLQAGEQVKVKIFVQNIGDNIAFDAKYSLFSRDPNIYLDNETGSLGDISLGAVKDFWVTISPNKRVNKQGKLPIYLVLTEKYSKGTPKAMQLPIELNQKPPKTEILEVVANVDNIQKNITRFEYRSNKFTTNTKELINIQEVPLSKTQRKKSVAVVFGVEHYKNLPPASYAENDAQIINKYLKNRLGVDQVVTYKSNEVEGFIFDDVFNPQYGELQKAIIKGETDLFVFYSGHGLPSKEGDEVFLFPADGKLERLNQQGYNLDKFYTNLENLGARSVTVFLDACFSGSSRPSEKIKMENLVAMKGIRIRAKYNRPWENNDNFSVFTSSTGEQTSLGFDASQTGLFTYFLCAGLQGEADLDGNRDITNWELFEYLKGNVENTSRKIRGLQTPEFFGNKDSILLSY